MDTLHGVERLGDLISNANDEEKKLIGKVIECISELDGADLSTSFLENLISEYIDVSEKLEVVTQKAEELNGIDELTHVFNQKKFREKLHDEINRKNRYKHDLAIIYMALNGFKEINEIYGHKTGDLILKEVGNLMSNFLREVDIVARWVGETFVILLPETDLGGCIVIAERLRDLIENHMFNHGNKITAAFGVTEYEENDDDQMLIERAREYLFEAKVLGPNMIVHH